MKQLRSRFPIYALFLRLYPAAYRRRYEQEMLQTTADMLDDAPNGLARIVIWKQVAFDLPLNIVRQNIAYKGGDMMSSTPGYIKRSSIAAALLLLPFFGAVTANGLDRLIYRSSLYNSWLWGRPALVIWVFYLPALAFVISLVSYVMFVVRGSDSHRAWLKRGFDIFHSWPVLTVGLVALGILTLIEFHDSTQCVVKSPVHAVTHMGQTLNCVEANRAIIPRHDFGL